MQYLKCCFYFSTVLQCTMSVRTFSENTKKLKNNKTACAPSGNTFPERYPPYLNRASKSTEYYIVGFFSVPEGAKYSVHDAEPARMQPSTCIKPGYHKGKTNGVQIPELSRWKLAASSTDNRGQFRNLAPTPPSPWRRCVRMNSPVEQEPNTHEPRKTRLQNTSEWWTARWYRWTSSQDVQNWTW